MAAFRKSSGPVSDREHTAFLNMWLERFFFCGSTLGPTTNMQCLAETLASGRPIPLGRYLLGATYNLMHQVASKLIANQPIGHLGGPWWFLQLWLNIYTSRAIDLPPFSSNTFPSDYAENNEPHRRRCTSLGEAAAVVPGERLSASSLADWFRAFYYGFSREGIVRFPYEDISDFEIPYRFRPDQPTSDAISASLFLAFISPSLLPIGVNTSSRFQHPSYEFYYPSFCARQLGLGQIPPSAFYADRLRARQPVIDASAFTRILHLADELPVGDFADVVLSDSCSKSFKIWWREWKLHLFNLRASSFLHNLPSVGSEQEVTFPPFFFLMFFTLFRFLNVSVIFCRLLM